jgi:HAD superfamily hydrolase (TIGR01459 family)
VSWRLQPLAGIAALAPFYDGFILDLWGVIHDGVMPMPGAIDCLAALVERGKRIALLSNAPRRAEDVVLRITRIGVPTGLYHHVMSSGEEAWRHLHDRDGPFYMALGRHCLQIGSDRDLGIREGLDLDFVDSVAAADFILNCGPAGWDDTVEDYRPLLDEALRRRLPMICANPDLVVQHGERLALCAGALAQYYEEQGGQVRWHGKPYRSVYDSCLALLGIAERRRVLAVGDSLRTDLAGAADAGLDSLLVAGGIHAEEFGALGTGELDLEKIAAALASGGYRPIGVVRRFTW